MRVREIRACRFKRFTDVTIKDLPQIAKLVVLVGENGSGKTSVFEALNHWRQGSGGFDERYHTKRADEGAPPGTAPPGTTPPSVTVAFHESVNDEMRRRAVYLRTAYRTQADFQVTNFGVPPPLVEEDRGRVARMVNADQRVSQNYQRLVSETTAAVYNETPADAQITKKELRESLIRPIQESMRRVFDDLVLEGYGHPHTGGTFLFRKGKARSFNFVNLSAGEKDAFDLLLDIHAHLGDFQDAVYCIDEPDLHMHPRLQSRLLAELVRLIPEKAQLWVATHSIGMLREAMRQHDAAPGRVTFLDFSGREYDGIVTITPAKVSRLFWTRLLGVSTGDLAALVAPARVVICEGAPVGDSTIRRPEFDARCYRSIFAEQFSESDFVSTGNADGVIHDAFRLAAALRQLLPGTEIGRVVDRDARTAAEIAELAGAGVRVLMRRNLESYLMDNEVLTALCQDLKRPADAPALIAARDAALASSIGRGNPADDFASAAGDFTVAASKLLGLTQAGSTAYQFMIEFLAPRLRPGMTAYAELAGVVFSPGKS